MAESPRPAPRAVRPTRHGPVAAACFGLALGMLGAAFAAVPFYRWFCAVTGYGGTPQVASLAPTTLGDRTIEVRFDANVFSGLPWRFAPDVPSIRVRTGEAVTVNFRIENPTDAETRGRAVFNVTPPLAAYWFTKLACFCFEEQVLKPHEVIEAPVTFFVDAGIDGDKNVRGLAGLTLSYTFFPAEEPRAAAVPAGPPTRSRPEPL
jgi:cytochrome c oxidase assembly protein subunit 11